MAEAGDDELVMGEFGNAEDSIRFARGKKTRLAQRLGTVSTKVLASPLRTLQEVFAKLT